MNHDPLPPVPTPIGQRWREFRVRVLPVMLFVTALGGVCFIWQRNLTAPMLVGAAEVRSAQVSAPYAGKIVQLKVDNFQAVTEGTPVAVLAPSDPRVALDVIRSKLDILQAKLDPHLTQQRNQTDYEQLRMDWLSQRVALATARVNLERARDALQRDEELHKQKLISDDVYDIALKTEEALAAEVTERSNLVVNAEAGVKRLEAMGAPQPETDPIQPLMDSLQAEEEKLDQAAAGTQPITLVAPMDGIVSAVYHRAGENLAGGETVLTITATQPAGIISYLRQPIPFEPKTGMRIEVRTRSLESRTGLAEIKSVGSQFEPITNALAVGRLGSPADLGLPIEITVPSGLKIRPGELVDLTVVSQN